MIRIDTDKDQGTFESQSGGWERIVRPDWTVSLSMHLLVLAIAGLVFFPIVTEKTVRLEVENLPSDVDIDPVSIEIEDFKMDNPLESVSLDIEEEPVEDVFVLPHSETWVEEDLAADTLEATVATQGVERHVPEVPAQQIIVDSIQRRVAKAGGKEGEVQFSLIWNSRSDLDLHVINPQGERIFYRQKVDRFGGVLDVDRNAKQNDLTDTPVENTRWLAGDARSGRYTVWIHLYQPRNENAVDFQLMAKTGDNTDLQDGRIELINRVVVFRYYYFSSDVTKSEQDKTLESWKQLQEQEEREAQALLRKAGFGRGAEPGLLAIASNYPHTNAAIEALKRVSVDSSK